MREAIKGKMAQKGQTEPELYYEFNKTALITRNVTKTLSSLFKYGCIAWCGYWLFDAIKVFAGNETTANILISLVMGLNIDKWIPIVFGIVCLIYGGIRNHQLKQTRKRHSKYISDLEKRLYPDRQSSRLNEYGETHEDDR